MSTRVTYANPWMTVREDSVRMPDGSLGVYGVVEKPDFALVIPVQGFDVFVASDLVEGPPSREATEQDMVHRHVTEPELARIVRAGDVIDAATVAALTLLRLATS